MYCLPTHTPKEITITPRRPPPIAKPSVKFSSLLLLELSAVVGRSVSLGKLLVTVGVWVYGDVEGCAVERKFEGIGVGCDVGTALGTVVEVTVGITVGFDVGSLVGTWLGRIVGVRVGLGDGSLVGICVGVLIGLNVMVGTLELGCPVG